MTEKSAAPISSIAEYVEGLNKPRSVNVEVPGIAILTKGSDIKPRPIRWLWNGWLARGKLALIGGQPGVGKTTLGLKLTAIVTSGGLWPDGTRATAGLCIIWSGEDDPDDTLSPRLEASGADMENIRVVTGVQHGEAKRAFDPAKDLAALKAAIDGISGEISMILIDPIVAAATGDSHKNSETRRSLQPIVDLAREYGAALLGIHHFTKGSEGANPVDRFTGSLAFGAVPRVLMVASRGEVASDGKPGPHIFMRAKSNIGQDDGGFHYDLHNVPLWSNPEIETSVVSFGESIRGNARDILAKAEAPEVEEEVATALRESSDFLLDQLADGPKQAKEIYAAAQDAGMSKRTVDRAKAKLSVASVKDGMGAGWVWKLPNGSDQDPKVAKVANIARHKNLATFDEFGNLRGESEAIRDKNATPWMGNGFGDGNGLDDDWSDEI
jgi:putative DNA primase/helicase